MRTLVTFFAIATTCLPSLGCGTNSPTASNFSALDDASVGDAQDASKPDAAADGLVGPPPELDATTDAASDGQADASNTACSPAFSFQPANPGTGDTVFVSFVWNQPLADVYLFAEGNGTAKQGHLTITGEKPWTWTWPMTFEEAGVWKFTFAAGTPQQVYGTCHRYIVDTGPPPELPQPDCTNKVCGESDGVGGTCDACPVVGTCLAHTSPYGPSGPGPWSCLDNAGCTSGGSCRIWCPGEPCDSTVHPDGCPQGVETCFVDPHITNYEDACRTCCESRVHTDGKHACWDTNLSLCRYPGDCGKPLLSPP